MDNNTMNIFYYEDDSRQVAMFSDELVYLKFPIKVVELPLLLKKAYLQVAEAIHSKNNDFQSLLCIIDLRVDEDTKIEEFLKFIEAKNPIKWTIHDEMFGGYAGFILCHALKSNFQGIEDRIIVITGELQAIMLRQLRELGVKQIIEKDDRSPDLLIEAVKNAFPQSQLSSGSHTELS